MKGQGAEGQKNETRVLMETRSRRATPSKKLDLQVNNSLTERESTETKPAYISNIYLPNSLFPI